MLRNMNSTGTRTQEHANNCSHNVLLACPTNGRFEYESPLRFHLLEEPTWNLFLQTIIFIISGCFVFAWNRCGHNRIAKGQDIGIFLSFLPPLGQSRCRSRNSSTFWNGR